MKIIHSTRLPKIGYVRTYNAYRCDKCGAEAKMSEYFLDGDCLPDGWSRGYVKDRGFSLQRDFCAASECRKTAASLLWPQLAKQQ